MVDKFSKDIPLGKIVVEQYENYNGSFDLCVCLERKDGTRISLIGITSDPHILNGRGATDGLASFLWGNTKDDNWTQCHTWSEDELLVE